MKLEQQLTSLETSQKLKALWVKQDTIYSWVFFTLDRDRKEWQLRHKPTQDTYNFKDSEVSAFTASELWEILPLFQIQKKWPDYYRWFSKLVGMEDYFMADDDTMAESMGKLLIYLLENKLM
jgi:hypothetical protein